MLPIEIGKLNGRYVVFWYENIDGKRSRRRFRLKAKSKPEARAEAARVYESQMALRGEELTLSDIWKQYEQYLGERKTARSLQDLWKQAGPELRGYHPNQINDEIMAEYLKNRKTRFFATHGRYPSGSTLFNEVNLIQSVLNYAYKKNIIEKPVTLKKPKRSEPRDRWLTREEIDQLLAAAESTPHLHVAIALMLSTAGRIGAILDLTWDRVDFEGRTIDLRIKKPPHFASDADRSDPLGPIYEEHMKKRAFIPMNDGLFDLLSEWKAHCDSEWVVEFHGRRVMSIKTAFNKAVKRSKLKGVHPHVLRHTAAVHMVASGCKMERVSQYLGHSSVGVTETVYARFAPDHMREESEALDFLSKKN